MRGNYSFGFFRGMPQLRHCLVKKLPVMPRTWKCLRHAGQREKPMTNSRTIPMATQVTPVRMTIFSANCSPVRI